MDLSPNGKCASYFALVMRWLHFLTQVTYYCMLPGMRKFAAFPQRELFREGANKQVISSQADSLIKISRIWAD
ncbi:hypothetical protein, partial [Klebsiella pneumoniae]|uniref:hypothetical protein n=1 Tax=Klebsiella pneumoniae TaxID=573 RepID=UPI001A9C4287